MSSIAFLLAVVFAFSATSVKAQTPAHSEKRAALQELIKLTGITQTANTIFVTLMDQYSQLLARDTIERFEKNDWPPAFKAKATALSKDFYAVLSRRLSDEVPKRIKYEERVGQLYLDAYEGYFTEEEARDLLAFYKSPVGQKFLGFGPAFTNQLEQKVRADIGTEVMAITREIVAEELKKLESRAAIELKAVSGSKKE